MSFVALKMLIGDRSKSLGIVMRLTFATFLITQQAEIFVGLMTRTYGFITDTGQADIWVMDPTVQFVGDIKPLQDAQLFRVRSEPYIMPKRSLTGDATERVDTRVPQRLFSFNRDDLPVYVGQQMDVIIETPPLETDAV